MFLKCLLCSRINFTFNQLNVTHFMIRKASNVPPGHTMNIFDRKMKRAQRNRAALDPHVENYDYLRDEVGFRLADRVFDIKRTFDVMVELGCARGHVTPHITNDTVKLIYQCDMSENYLSQSKVSPDVPTVKLVVDEEFIPFKENSTDIIVSNLSLHWVNDLPGTFKQIFTVLKEDAVFLGTMFGGDTLYELRVSLQQAEMEKEGGYSPHVSPFVEPQDVGALLNGAGFTMLTIDTDDVIVNYPGMKELMYDLKGMGESNATWKRRLRLHRATMATAAEIYKERYSNEDKSIHATFQILSFIGWKPHASQPKAAKRGSATVSFKDLEDFTKQKSK